MPSTEEVLASHEAALGEQNAGKISTHYARDAVVIVNGHTYQGTQEIALMYAKLLKDLPDAIWSTHVAVIHDDLAFVEWACEAVAVKVDFGTDTFLVVDGLITRQTASFSIVARD